jgi:hypothetical protein
MGSSVQEKTMHYPVMTEKHLADRWRFSIKTLQRWRLNGEGPLWHKLFCHVRYHEADILEFEHRSAQHLMTLLGINREFKPVKPDADQDLDAETAGHYLTAKEIAKAASLPIHFFLDQAERNRKYVPHLMLVGNLRFSLPTILQWEMANSVAGGVAAAAGEAAASPEKPSEPAKRWYEIVSEQEAQSFLPLASTEPESAVQARMATLAEIAH